MNSRPRTEAAAQDGGGGAVADVTAAHRNRLVGIAYRILGSVADAEDAVQEALVRLERHGLDGIDDAAGWLVRTTSRICLDRLRSAQSRREVYVGPWLPEPLASTTDEDPVEQAETLSMAFLVVLEALSPPERVGFLLHDVFGYGYDDVAQVLGRSEAACRKLASRARAAVAARRPRFAVEREQQEEVTSRFLAACLTGEVDSVLEVLAPNIVLTSDGGGVVSAARRPVVGADRVARFLVGLVRQAPADLTMEYTPLNRSAGLIVRRPDGGVELALVLEVEDRRVTALYAIRNPAKLRHLRDRG